MPPQSHLNYRKRKTRKIAKTITSTADDDAVVKNRVTCRGINYSAFAAKLIEDEFTIYSASSCCMHRDK